MLQLNFNAYTTKIKSNFGIKKRNNKNVLWNWKVVKVVLKLFDMFSNEHLKFTLTIAIHIVVFAIKGSGI